LLVGSFGAAAGNSASQGFHAGPGGFGANAAFTGSQTYNLPNKQTVGVSYGGCKSFMTLIFKHFLLII
jgi:hypothetical protein